MPTIMKVPLLDLKAQHATIRAEIRQAVEEVFDSQQFILGSQVRQFEEGVAEYVGMEASARRWLPFLSWPRRTGFRS